MPPGRRIGLHRQTGQHRAVVVPAPSMVVSLSRTISQIGMEEPINLLLVDDEPRNLDALEAILDDPSYHLLRADNADAALRQLLQHPVAAIVLDIKMPGVSGFELANLIKGTRKYRQIPIVFLTAYHVEDADIMAGYSAGAVDYLTKPVKPQILRHKIA